MTRGEYAYMKAQDEQTEQQIDGGNLHTEFCGLDRIKEAERKYYDEQDVELTADLAKAWLDTQIDMLWAFKVISHNVPKALYCGTAKESYPTVISRCTLIDIDSGEDDMVHLYRGIQVLADALGKSLQTRRLDRVDSVEKYFMYRGYKVFQLDTSGEF